MKVPSTLTHLSTFMWPDMSWYSGIFWVFLTILRPFSKSQTCPVIYYFLISAVFELMEAEAGAQWELAEARSCRCTSPLFCCGWCKTQINEWSFLLILRKGFVYVRLGSTEWPDEVWVEESVQYKQVTGYSLHLQEGNSPQGSNQGVKITQDQQKKSSFFRCVLLWGTWP